MNNLPRKLIICSLLIAGAQSALFSTAINPHKEVLESIMQDSLHKS